MTRPKTTARAGLYDRDTSLARILAAQKRLTGEPGMTAQRRTSLKQTIAQAERQLREHGDLPDLRQETNEEDAVRKLVAWRAERRRT